MDHQLTDGGSAVNGNSYTSDGDNLEPLNIVVVGAGIGGLSAGIFLRQQGHHVVLLEQSRFANELGAAVHLAPNANGLLRRMGIWAEKTGANPALKMTGRRPDGGVLFATDLAQENKMWQHPWLLAHRVHLHSELKRKATTAEGQGRPADLRTSSKVEDVDPQTGTISLASGEQIHADVIIGADGVHSKTRAKLPGAADIKTFGSGKSAFRFLIPRETALADPETAKFAGSEGELTMFMGRDRRVVIYPTSDNTLLNFVCIHPTAESEVKTDGADWNQQGHKEKLLDVYKTFEPALLKLLNMADAETLKVWELLDMEQLPTWTVGNLVAIGDAAHPFTPHQGQGAGQAIEDAASLAVVLPLGTKLDEIPERLKLYEKCRYERASRIQEYSRLAGKDLGDGPPVDINEYTGYNFGHDEWDASTHNLRTFIWSKKPDLYWRNPVSFGPMPGPRQSFSGAPHNGSIATFTTASIKFKTSRTVLQNLLPTSSMKFASPATVAYATFSVTTLDNLEWLGGKGYSHFGLYIHGVQYKSEVGEEVLGTYLPVLFEDLADPIVSGREELGMPKTYAELDVRRIKDAFRLDAFWKNTTFADFTLDELVEQPSEATSSTTDPADQGLLWYKQIPATSSTNAKQGREVDAAYAVFLPHTEETTTVTKKVGRVFKAGKSSIKFDAVNRKALPTLHHIVERLAEIPVYEIVEAKITEGTGVSDVRGAKRLH